MRGCEPEPEAEKISNGFTRQLSSARSSDAPGAKGPVAEFSETVSGAVDISWYNDGAGPFTIADEADPAGLAYLVNSGNSFSGKTIEL